MNTPTTAIDSSRRSNVRLTAGLLLVLSLLATVAAAQQYAPPGYSPAPAYAAPPAPAPAYSPPPAYGAPPAPAPAYAPPPTYAAPPAPAPAYAPPPAYAAPPAPAPGYAQPPAYAPAPGYAPAPAYVPAQANPPPQGYAAPQGYAPPPAYMAPPTFVAPIAEAPATAASASGTDQVSDFVRKITQSTRFDRASVARWRAPLCISVEGLPASENAFVVQRLSQIASGAGAQVQSESCAKGSYNFRVLFTLNAERAARDWYTHHRDLFEENAGSPAQIDKFVDPSPAGPVRVWHNATLFGTDGEPFVRVDPGYPVEPLPPVQYTGSRLTSPGVLGLNYAVVIVDGTKTNGAGLAPLADYVAMAGLAELDLGADLGDDPTILRLFTAPANVRPAGLTAWDMAFLSALYRTTETPKNLRSQLAATVSHDVSASPY